MSGSEEDTSSVAGLPSSQEGPDHHGLTPLEMELLASLREIDAMPHYVAPIPDNFISSLHRRYERALSVAKDAIAKAEGRS